MKKAIKRVRRAGSHSHVLMATDCHKEDEGHILCSVSEDVTALMACRGPYRYLHYHYRSQQHIT